MQSNAYRKSDFIQVRQLIGNEEFRRAYNLLHSMNDRNGEWYYLAGLSAMNMGYYDEGQDYLKRAKFMEPSNNEYVHAYNKYNNYSNNYNRRSYDYNRNRRYDSSGCCCCCDDACCCCCGDDCCNDLCTLYICDSCCECFGGDICTCF